MKATVDIFSGFLGAGKTMLIKKLLSEKAYGNSTVIIENEFGEVGIDGELLKGSNIEIKEINSGCICCQVSGNFGDSIIEVIKKYNPENIIIEPSGVAKLSEILKTLQGIKFQHLIDIRNIYTLIDVKNYNSYLINFKEFYENQIRNANKIVLSRTQFIDEKTLNNVISSLQSLNSRAEVIYKSWDLLCAKDFMKSNIPSENVRIIKKGNIKTIKKQISHSADEVFDSYPITLNRKINKSELVDKFKLISQTDRYGKIIRAKGMFEGDDNLYYQFDYVTNEFKIRNIKWSNKKVVSLIGSNLNKKELLNLFN